MSSKTSRPGRRLAFAMAAGIGVVCASVAPGLAQPAPAPATTSIAHGSERARLMKEPSFQTREARLAAKPLDWTTTIGTPKPRILTPAERRALEIARPTSSAGGAPSRDAEKVARKLHPEDWK